MQAEYYDIQEKSIGYELAYMISINIPCTFIFDILHVEWR